MDQITDKVTAQRDPTPVVTTRMCGGPVTNHAPEIAGPARMSCSNDSSEEERAEQLVPERESSSSGALGKVAVEDDVCRVCGDGHAKMHYGVIACFGCKGFFRRALKRVNQYKCANNGNCVINKYERNSCRFCRLQRCLEVGMDPAAVRPDRDFTGPQHALRLPVIRKASKDDASERKASISEAVEWSKRLPVEMRTMLMNMLNIETKVIKGDTKKKPDEVYPLPESSLRELIENPSRLKGLRTEMRYEPYRMTENSELVLIAYRRVIAAVDWITYLSEMLHGIAVDDKIALVKSCFAPLLVFTFAVRTAEVTADPDILCMCTFSYVPRNMAKAYTDSYHLSNGLVERALDELVAPLRKLKLKQEEIVCLEAIIALNPHAKDLSAEGAEKIVELRNRIQETLHQVIKETRSRKQANVLFGNLLLFLSNVTLIANSMCENLQFAQTFSNLGSIPLLTNLFGCFPVEPFNDQVPSSSKFANPEMILGMEQQKPAAVIHGPPCLTAVDVAVQVDAALLQRKRKKLSRVEPTLLTPVENSCKQEFNLLQAPCTYTLTEMFDDRYTDATEQFVAQMKDQAEAAGATAMDWSPCQQSSSSKNPPPPSSSVFCYDYHQQEGTCFVGMPNIASARRATTTGMSAICSNNITASFSGNCLPTMNPTSRSSSAFNLRIATSQDVPELSTSRQNGVSEGYLSASFDPALLTNPMNSNYVHFL